MPVLASSIAWRWRRHDVHLGARQRASPDLVMTNDDAHLPDAQRSGVVDAALAGSVDRLLVPALSDDRRRAGSLDAQAVDDDEIADGVDRVNTIRPTPCRTRLDGENGFLSEPSPRELDHPINRDTTAVSARAILGRPIQSAVDRDARTGRPTGSSVRLDRILRMRLPRYAPVARRKHV